MIQIFVIFSNLKKKLLGSRGILMQIFICQIYEQIFWVNPHPEGVPVIILLSSKLLPKDLHQEMGELGRFKDYVCISLHKKIIIRISG
jgi:hypothetical protein